VKRIAFAVVWPRCHFCFRDEWAVSERLRQFFLGHVVFLKAIRNEATPGAVRTATPIVSTVWKRRAALTSEPTTPTRLPFSSALFKNSRLTSSLFSTARPFVSNLAGRATRPARSTAPARTWRVLWFRSNSPPNSVSSKRTECPVGHNDLLNCSSQPYSPLCNTGRLFQFCSCVSTQFPVLYFLIGHSHAATLMVNVMWRSVRAGPPAPPVRAIASSPKKSTLP
jgi:hypothetical protein